MPQQTRQIAKLISLAALLLLATHVWAQAAAKPPAFEVASVKMVAPGQGGLTKLSSYGGASFTATSASMRTLIQVAYGVNDNQIAGKPEWIEQQLYDINAKLEGAGGLTYDQTKPLVQQLLAERFHLTVHREMKESSGYALVVAKGGPRLERSKGPGNASQNGIGRDGLRFQSLTLKAFAAMLAFPAGQPVVDKTGIEGNYDFKLSYAPPNSTDSQLPSLFTALQEQLGLKLEAQKLPLGTLVIDHVDRTPTEN